MNKGGPGDQPPHKDDANQRREIEMNEESLAKRYALQAFKSTPNFIHALTTISLKVLESQNKMQSLMDGIAAVNKNLPASVYIPFVNSAWRNYCVLNIVESESKLFLTNTKAPFLVCIEVYRPEEILITSQSRYQHLLGNTGSIKGGQSQHNMPISGSPHTQLPDMIIGTSSNRNATPSQSHIDGQNPYNSPNISYNQNSNAFQLLMPSGSNDVKIKHAMKKLHLNCDRQLSQGQIIKNFFPNEEIVNANEFMSIEGRKDRYYPKTMTNSMDFNVVGK